MKLRNKKTGEIKSIEEIIREAFLSNELDSLKSIDTNWEEIEAKEPLIKDKKIRKAVRAWAEANDLDGASYYTSSHHWYLRSFNHREQGIDFWLNLEDGSNLTENKHYTITELCGEEEECES